MLASPVAAMGSTRRPSHMQFYTPSSTNLFVRYLPHEVDDNRLREIFSAYGNITSSMVMRDIHNGQSLGTAFVRYATHEEALRALQNAHGLPMAGKTIAVQWARQQHDGTPAGQDRLKMNKLFLRNVPEGVTEDEIVDLVRMHGSVVKVTMHNDTEPFMETSERRRIVFITFSEPGAAEAARRAIHNTCAFSNCHGIPLMCKLINDAVKSKKHRSNSVPGDDSMGDSPAVSSTTSNSPCVAGGTMQNVTDSSSRFLRKASVCSLSVPHISQVISSSEDSMANTPSRSRAVSQWDFLNSTMTPTRGLALAVPRPIGCDSSDASHQCSGSDASQSSRFCHNPYSMTGEKTYV